MARQAIIASATATHIPDEIAARNSERTSERKRTQDAETASDAVTEEDAVMIMSVLEATEEVEERDRRELCARSLPCSSNSVAKVIDVEESPKGKPKRRRDGNEKDKQSQKDDIKDDEKSTESDPVPRRKSSRKTRVQASMEVDLGCVR